MATKRVKIKGKLYWVKLGPDNLDMGYDDAWKDAGGRSSINMDLTAEEYKKLKAAGSGKQKKESKDNPDLIRVSLDRPWESPDWDTDNKLGGCPAIVFKDTNTPYDEVEDGYIGNGTEAEVILTIYTTRIAGRNGTRLDKIIITDLLTYNPDEDLDDMDEPAEEKPAKKVRKPVDEDLEDELPF